MFSLFSTRLCLLLRLQLCRKLVFISEKERRKRVVVAFPDEIFLPKFYIKITNLPCYSVCVYARALGGSREEGGGGKEEICMPMLEDRENRNVSGKVSEIRVNCVS